MYFIFNLFLFFGDIRETKAIGKHLMISSTYQVASNATGIAGNLFAFLLFVSPILLNCLICLWYGLPFVSPNLIMIATVNSVGAIFQLIYITTFIFYAENARKVKTTGLLVSVFGVFAIISLVSMKFDPFLRRTFVGYLSLASFVSLFASSLSIIDLVIRMKSVEFLSFYPSLSTFMMSASFFSYGMLKHDAFIYIPNGIGAILGVTHLALYAYYSRESREEEFRQSLIRSF